MDKKVRAELETCLACQATGQPSQPEPLRSTPLPNKAWDKLKIDFYGPLPTGQYILVILDCYSRFPEVEVLSSISAKIVIPKLDAVFARHGVPSQVVSDNGPPFQGHDFNRYMTKMGIQHTTSTPLWPQGNAEVEAFMKPLGKAIRTANLEGRPWKQELSKFLLAYRSTPHSTTKVPPAQLLYNREIRGKLPTLPHNSKVLNRHSEAKHNDQEQKQRGKRYADTRRHAKTSKLRVGDSVLVRQKKKNKFSTNFSPTPYTIIAIKGSKVVARNQQQHVITRNVSFFKKIAGQAVGKDEVDEDVVSRRREEDGEQVQEQCLQEQQEPRRSTRNTRQTNFYGHPMNSGEILK